jgi:hypothetical protein
MVALGQAVDADVSEALGRGIVSRAMVVLDSGLTADLRPGDKAALASTIATLHKALNPQDKRGPQVQINILADGESARRALANLGVISDAGEVIDVEAQDAGQGGES